MPFLDKTIEKNPGLIRSAVFLHQEGKIPANTLLLDLDAFDENATMIKDEAERLGLHLYFMTKQIGRNPIVVRKATEDGRAKTVAVDIQDAKALHYNGISLGHVGNVSQIGNHELRAVIGRMRPEVLSVFTVQKAEAASRAAIKNAVEQDLLIRVRDDDDLVPAGTSAGIHLKDLDDAVREIQKLPNVRIVGVTTWPAIIYSNASQPEAAPNFRTLRAAAERLEKLGVEIFQINAPGNTSFTTLRYLKDQGATHVEPGSALSGHTTLHLYDGSPERPATVYVTEVSHYADGEAWALGGGFFLDDPPVPELEGFAKERRALVGTDPKEILDRRVPFTGVGGNAPGSFGGIDYYGTLEVDSSDVSVGDTVVMGFRTQAFVTRANVGVVEGVGGDSPKLLGLFDVQGRRLDDEKWW